MGVGRRPAPISELEGVTTAHVTKRADCPELVGLEITRRCNLTCPHCYSAAASRSTVELSADEYRRLIDELAELGTRAIGWTGGEPLLREDLYALIEYANGKGIRSGVTTNGVLLDLAAARRLQALGVKSLQISLDGTTAEKSAAIRRTTAAEFEKILEALRICQELGISTHIAMLLGRETLDDARDMVELAERVGASSLRFCGFVPHGRGHRQDVRERLAVDEVRTKLRELVDWMQTQQTIQVYFDPAVGPLPPDHAFHECMAGVKFCYINSRGDVYPCTSLLHPRFKVGNVRRSSIAAIWNTPRMTEMATMDRSRIAGPCAECRHFAECQGACRGIAYAHTGDVLASFPNCLTWESGTA